MMPATLCFYHIQTNIAELEQWQTVASTKDLKLSEYIRKLIEQDSHSKPIQEYKTPLKSTVASKFRY